MKQTLTILRGRLCLLLCLGLFAACSSDDDEQTPSKKTYPLTIEVAENPLVNEGGEPVATKATITTTSSLNKFYMSYMYAGGESSEKETATKDVIDGKWKNSAGAELGWPSVATDVTVNWYAYTGGTFYRTDDADKKPYIDFTDEEYAFGQHDLLVATASGTYSGTGGKLSFTFDHVCSALRFLVKKATNLGTSTLTVTKIKLCNVKKNGQYYFNSGEWQSVQTEAEYTLYEGDSKSITDSYEYLNGSENDSYLFLIPQQLTGGTGTSETYVEVTWQSNYGTPTSGVAKIPLTKTLAKGYQYDVKINIGRTTLTDYSN